MFKNVMGGGNSESDSSNMMDDLNETCTCSRKTRLIGFVTCAGIGMLISFLVRLLFAGFRCCPFMHAAAFTGTACLGVVALKLATVCGEVCAVMPCISQSMFAIMKPVTFAILYTIGNIISLCSTAFLVGPVKQIKNMFAEKRLIATIVFLVSMIITLVVAIAVRPHADARWHCTYGALNPDAMCDARLGPFVT